MRHQDNAGHEGVIASGGVQWMTAGRGIVHSEMPEQTDGLLHGFQLWVNLPARHKMDAPRYQEHAQGQIPTETRQGGVAIQVICGATSLGTTGPIEQPLTEPLYLDIDLPPDSRFGERLPLEHNAFVVVIDGRVLADDGDDGRMTIASGDLGILSRGDYLELGSGASGARCLLVAGKPLHEPVARGGPFVMTTKAEVRQAQEDFAAGRF